MIIKTLYTRNSAKGWVGYIGYKSRMSADLDRRMKGVFNGVGEKANRNDIEWLVNVSEDVNIARMIIFSPADGIDPIFLSEYTLRTMWEFLNKQGRGSVRFVYALHYNTPHPHSHVVMTAYYPDDLVIYEGDIKYLEEVAYSHFKEEVGVMQKISKAKDKSVRFNKQLRKIAELESKIEIEQLEEEREMRAFVSEIKTIDDVMRHVGIEIGL